jgi:hypothetical protein
MKIKIYGTIILHVVLYGFETCSLTSREDRRLKMFENRGLRRIFGLKKDKVTGGWRKLHNEELHNLYRMPNLIRMMKSRKMNWARLVARVEAKRSTYRVLVGKTVGKRPLGRHRRSWEDNIKLMLEK